MPSAQRALFDGRLRAIAFEPLSRLNDVLQDGLNLLNQFV